MPAGDFGTPARGIFGRLAVVVGVATPETPEAASGDAPDFVMRTVTGTSTIGSRAPESREVALRRMASHGAEIVTTEMVVFEWLRTAEHPSFKEVQALIK